MKRLLGVLVLSGLTAQAQTITETFGSGANQFSIDFVTIGNPGNAADPEGLRYGSVSYVYHIGKYEVSRDMVDKANPAGGLGISLYDMSRFGGNGVNRPATGFGWFGAARFVNWLNTSQGYLPAYKFDSSGNFQLWSTGEIGYNPNNQFRNALARYVIQNHNEWYKAAFGSPNGVWYDYSTGSDSPPASVPSGTSPNTAIFGGNYGSLYGSPVGNSPADVDNAGGLSAWGTMAQGGNVGEFMENARDGLNDSTTEIRELRTGAWMDNAGATYAHIHFAEISPSEFGSNDWGLKGSRLPLSEVAASARFFPIGATSL